MFVVLFIAVGLFMFTFQSTQFNLEGFLMVMTASVLSGLRWTLAQLVLQKNEIGWYGLRSTEKQTLFGMLGVTRCPLLNIVVRP